MGTAATASPIPGYVIFLSYAREDYEEVADVRSKLLIRGYRPWMDRFEIGLGQNWASVTKEQITKSDFFMLFISRHIVQDGFLQTEITRALEFMEQMAPNAVYIIPVLLEDVEVPIQLRRYHRVDVVEFDRPDAWNRLHDTLRAEMERRNLSATEQNRDHAESGDEFRLELPKLDLKSLDMSLEPVETIGQLTLQKEFVSQIHEGKFGTAREVLGELGKLGGKIEAASRWLDELQWRQSLPPNMTWLEFAANLQNHLKGSYPEPWRREYAPLADDLEKAWWRAVDQILSDFYDDVIGASESRVAEALRDLDSRFTPLFIQSLPEALGSRSLSEPETGLIALIKTVIPNDRTSPAIWLERIRVESTPPDPIRLSAVLSGFHDYERRRSAAIQLASVLHQISEKAGLGGATRLATYLSSENLTNLAEQASPNALEYTSKLLLWISGLKLLLHDELASGEQSRIVLVLRQAGSIYPAALTHAALAEQWFAVRSAWDQFRSQALKTFPDSDAPLIACREISSKLTELVAKPLEDNPPDPSAANDIRDSIVRLKTFSTDLERFHCLWIALGFLRNGKFDACAVQLEKCGGHLKLWISAAQRERALWEARGSQEFRRSPFTVSFEMLEAGVPDNISAALSLALSAIDEASRSDALFRGFTVPFVNAIKNNLGTLEQASAIWQKAREALAVSNFVVASAALRQLETVIPDAAYAARIAEYLTRSSGSAWADSADAEAWRLDKKQLESQQKELGQLTSQGDFFGKQYLDAVVEQRNTQIEDALAAIDRAIAAEGELHKCLRLIEERHFSQALNCLSSLTQSLELLPSSLVRAILLWKQASEALGALAEEQSKGKKIESIGLDPETGLPPEEPTLRAAQSYWTYVQESATRASELLQRAEKETSYTCRNLDIIETDTQARTALADIETLLAFRAVIAKVEVMIEEDNWSEGLRMVLDFPFEADQPAYFKLVNALGQAQDVAAIPCANEQRRLSLLREINFPNPLLKKLEQEKKALEEKIHGPAQIHLLALQNAARELMSSRQPPDSPAVTTWLTAVAPPVLQVPAELLEVRNDSNPKQLIKKILQAAGVGATALEAACGNVKAVLQQTDRADLERPPINLVAAVFSPRRLPGEAPSKEAIKVALGVCALFACYSEYRQKVASDLHWAQPKEWLQDPDGLIPRTRNALIQLFQSRGLPWGHVEDPQSCAMRFEVECFASKGMQISTAWEATRKQIRWPLGPALIEFYGLNQELAEITRKDAQLRGWFNLGREARALHWLGQTRAALQIAPKPEDVQNPQERQDMTLLQAELRIGLLNQPALLQEANAGRFTLLEEYILQAVDAVLAVENQPTAQQYLRTLRIRTASLCRAVATARTDSEQEITTLRERYDSISRLVSGVKEKEPILSSHIRVERAKVSTDLAYALLEARSDCRDPQAIKDSLKFLDEAVADAPREPLPNVARLVVALLLNREQPGTLSVPPRRAVDLLLQRAATFHWSIDVFDAINQMSGVVESESGLYESLLDRFNQRGSRA